MPFSAESARRAGFSNHAIAESPAVSPRNQPQGSHDIVSALSDVVPVPYLMKVMSVGDLLLILGITTAAIGVFKNVEHGDTQGDQLSPFLTANEGATGPETEVAGGKGGV